MDRALHAPTRLTIVAALHVLVLGFSYEWWTLGPHYVGHAYLPGHDFLLEGALGGICLVLVFPILLSGRPLQRTLASALSVLPAVLCALAVYYALRINAWVRG